MKSICMILIVCLGFMISGCYQVADNSDIIRAQYICRNLGGVNYIRIDAVGQEMVRCMSGFRQFASEVELPINYKY